MTVTTFLDNVFNKWMSGPKIGPPPLHLSVNLLAAHKRFYLNELKAEVRICCSQLSHPRLKALHWAFHLHHFYFIGKDLLPRYLIGENKPMTSSDTVSIASQSLNWKG